jgi:predicted dehydrogenase
MRSLLNVLVIGAGVMGQAYAQAIATGGLRFRTRVSAVCDLDRAAAEALAAQCGAEAFTNLGQALEMAEADLAYIAVPDHLHREPFLRCVEGRVPCLVEKPLATTVADALEMQAAARAARTLAQVNFSNRFNPPLMRVREALSEGAIGEVIGVNGRLSNVIEYPLRHLRWASQTTSGWFLLSHVFDIVHWLTEARAVEVTAAGRRGKLAEAGVDAPDIIQSLVRYDAGFSGIYESAWVLPRSLPSGVDFKVEIVGEDGVAHVDTQDQMVHIASAQALTYPSTLDWTEARMGAFLDWVEEGAVPNDLLEDGVENTRMLVALHQSLEQRRAVDVASVVEEVRRDD